jgi:hypothetical protein
MFSGLFSATFCQILEFYGLQFFPAMDNFLEPLLSYLAENSAIWQQWCWPDFTLMGLRVEASQLLMRRSHEKSV